MSEHRSFSMLLERVIKQSEAPPSSIVYLCGTIASLERIKHFLFGTVYYAPQPLTDHEKYLLYQESPDFVIDFVIDSVEDLLECLSIKVLGYAGEVAADESRLISNPFDITRHADARACPHTDARACPHTNARAWPHTNAPSSANTKAPSVLSSSSISCIQPTETIVKLIKLPNHIDPQSPFWICGRYFGHLDPRQEFHAYSLMLVNFKTHSTSHADLFADLLIEAIQHATAGAFDLITQAPCRPESENRLNYCLSAMKTKLTLDYGQLVETDTLRCSNSYPALKSLNAKSRSKAVSKAFQVQKDVCGKRVVVIDDIITTGATMNACIKQLKNAGALSITPVVLAYHPYAIKGRLAREEIH